MIFSYTTKELKNKTVVSLTQYYMHCCVILSNIIWLYVTGFTKTVPIGTRNEIQFIADY